MYGPEATWARLGAASSPEGREIDDFTDVFDLRRWTDGEHVQIGALDVLPRLLCHPTESYGMRFTDPSGATFVYSGDTGYCDALIELAAARTSSCARRRGPIRPTVRRSCTSPAPRQAAPPPKPVSANCC